MRTTVVKIGGSLLRSPGGMQRVDDWLRANASPGERRLLIAGGGPVVDGLREIDAANGLSAEAAHLAGVRLMDANTRLLPDWLEAIRITDLLDPIDDLQADDYAALVFRWLSEVEPSLPGARLRAGWDSTSDSIAARAACCLNAELVLLKHSVSTGCASIAELGEAGIVDPEFVRHALGVRAVRVIGVTQRPSIGLSFNPHRRTDRDGC